MRSLLIVFLLSFGFTFSLHSQTFYFLDNPQEAVLAPCDPTTNGISIEFYGSIYNGTSMHPVTVKIRTIKSLLPSDWTFTCSNSSNPTEDCITLLDFEKALSTAHPTDLYLNFGVNPNSQDSEVKVWIEVFDLNDSINSRDTLQVLIKRPTSERFDFLIHH